MKKPLLKEIESKLKICVGHGEMIYYPGIAGMAQVGVEKVDGMMEYWRDGSIEGLRMKGVSSWPNPF